MASPTSTPVRFSCYVPILKSVDSGGEWFVEGPLSDPGSDLQGETMDMSGLRKGLDTYTRLGMNVDWEHRYSQTKDPKWIIGKGVKIFDASHPVTGENVPHLRTRLFKDKEIARNAVDHLRNGGTLGYSVEGGAIRKSGTHILEPIITMVTMTPQPVVSANTGTVALVKGLSLTDALPRIPSIELPISDETFMDMFMKALDITGANPRSASGADALQVQDFCETCERSMRDCECEKIEKALSGILSWG